MSSNTQSENEFSIEKEYATTLALSKFKPVYQTYKYYLFPQKSPELSQMVCFL